MKISLILSLLLLAGCDAATRGDVYLRTFCTKGKVHGITCIMCGERGGVSCDWANKEKEAPDE